VTICVIIIIAGRRKRPVERADGKSPTPENGSPFAVMTASIASRCLRSASIRPQAGMRSPAAANLRPQGNWDDASDERPVSGSPVQELAEPRGGHLFVGDGVQPTVPTSTTYPPTSPATPSQSSHTGQGPRRRSRRPRPEATRSHPRRAAAARDLRRIQSGHRVQGVGQQPAGGPNVVISWVKLLWL
jgi:hypothetical protein